MLMSPYWWIWFDTFFDVSEILQKKFFFFCGHQSGKPSYRVAKKVAQAVDNKMERKIFEEKYYKKKRFDFVLWY
jgi:hypothetical protein